MSFLDFLRNLYKDFCGDFEVFLPKILEFFCGLFVGIGVLGALIYYFVFEKILGLPFLSALLAFIIFCVFVFFALVAKTLCVLLKQNKTQN